MKRAATVLAFVLALMAVTPVAYAGPCGDQAPVSMSCGHISCQVQYADGCKFTWFIK